MSVVGKNKLSYKKQNVPKQAIPHTGVKTITFAHEFTLAGEDFLPFNALVTPSEWSSSGLVNPLGSTLLAAQLQAFKQNVTVTSSARGLIQKSEYIVKNSGILFKNITSLANEVFEVEVADIMVTGNQIADMRKIRVEGVLTNGTTDFALGNAVNVFDEEVIVFRDGLQMFRSDSNDDSGATGNYYYMNVAENGTSSIISFFEPAIGDEAIMVVSTGGIVDSPNISTFQQIETLAGQLDNVIPTVAALAGVPESNFRSAPNNVDLQAFGSKVLQLLEVNIPVVTEWTPFLPTTEGFGVITNNESRWRRVGDTMELVVYFNAGTLTATQARVYLPNSETIDALKNISTKIAGYVIRNVAEVSVVEIIPLATGGLDYFTIGRRTTTHTPLTPRLATEFTGNTQLITFFASVPISNWGVGTKIKDIL